MSYREYRPSPELAPYVACYWSRAASASGETRVLPDGCVDFLCDVGASRPEVYVVGTMTRPLLVSGWSSYVAVRFRPAGVRAFLNVRVGELTDRSVELAALGPAAASWLERVGDPPTFVERVRALDRLLAAELGRARPLEPRVVGAVRRIEAARGAVGVAALSQELGVSRQHLRRLFERDVGVSPKTFARVARVQSIVERLGRSGRPGSWAELAVDAGYFDQSHFVNDFRGVTGLTPEAYVAGSISPRPEATRSTTLSA